MLRFQMSFPDSYPSLPPLVTFSTDLFHPLLTPLTTYTYSTDVHFSGTVSATDDERLPPGGFSLRHGFPRWFGRASRSIAGSRSASGATITQPPRQLTTPPRATTRPGEPAASPAAAASGASASSSAAGRGGSAENPVWPRPNSEHVPVYEVLRYLRAAFDDAELLDSVPLEAAGNPGAWHAWRTYRRGAEENGGGGQAGKDSATAAGAEGAAREAAQAGAASPSHRRGASSATRDLGEWDWEGVWEDRVKKGIDASLSEQALFGVAGGPDEVVCLFKSAPPLSPKSTGLVAMG